MNFSSSPNPNQVETPEWSVESSYPSIHWETPHTSNKNIMYEFTFSDGNMVVSSGMMTRLCQEGHIFKMLLFGGNGFRNEALPNINIQTLQYYGITKQSFQALVFSLRTNNPNAAYKYRFVYESIGGFKTIDKHHIKRMKKKKEKSQEVNNSLNSSTMTYRTTINLLSDDEESSPV